jgi:hypothetical protein
MAARFLLAFGIATALYAQQDPMDLLRRVQAKVSDSINRLPKYMCTESVDRSRYQADNTDRGSACDEKGSKRKMHLATSDRLRMDVGMAASGEMYSWVGESRFDDRDLFDMVKEGAMSTGSFASFLIAIFRADDVNFTYNGETNHNGRALSEFGFQIPYEKSHYHYGQGIHQVTTAWEGTFLADPRTADLVRLEAITSQLPAETGACYASTALDYAQVRLKGMDFLLPSASVLTIPDLNGGEAVNRTAFSSCHEFLGESKITFDPAPDARVENAHGPSSQDSTLPPGLSFQVAFTQGFDTGSAAAGDPVKAKLITPIQKGKKVLVPVGSKVAARIVRMRQFFGDTSDFSLEVKLETVEIGGVAVRLTAGPDTGVHFEQKKGPETLQRRVDLGTLRGLEDRSASFVFYHVQVPYLIVSGLESSWVTK